MFQILYEHVVSLVVTHVLESRVHLALELGHVLEHTDSTCDSTARVKHVVFTVVSAQQLHVLRHPDGTDEVNAEEEEEGGRHGPDDDDDSGQALYCQQVPFSRPDDSIIPDNE